MGHLRGINCDGSVLHMLNPVIKVQSLNKEIPNITDFVPSLGMKQKQTALAKHKQGVAAAGEWRR